MQLSGSFLQSVLQRKRSHANQPMGGVLANPFSNEYMLGTNSKLNITAQSEIHNRFISLTSKFVFCYT